MVYEEDFERACEIISDFQSNVKPEVSKSEYSLKDSNYYTLDLKPVRYQSNKRLFAAYL
jgi:hypothetical protein